MKKKLLRFLYLFTIWGSILAVIGGTAFATLAILKYNQNLPPLTPLEDYSGDPDKWALPSKVYDRNGNLIGEFATEKRELISYRELPDHLVKAFLAAEDARFFEHRGVDFYGIVRAAWKNLLSWRIAQGGSTITQQLAKNLFLTRERSLKRKVQEAFLALKIERRYTKEEILERYLNYIYLGHNCYGLKEAARYYFGKEVSNLTVAESAYLAGLPKAPNTYSLIKHPKKAERRQKYVLTQMVSRGYLTEDQAETDLAQFWKKWESDTETIRTVRNRPKIVSGYLSEMVRRKLLDEGFENYAVYRGGLIIETTFDLELQKAAETIVTQHLAKLNERFREENPDSPPYSIEGALVTIDQHTGEVLTAVGGSGFSVSNQINRVYQTRRQPGSAFKPFLFAAALDSGKFTPSSLILDQPAYFFPYPGGEPWIPENYEKKFHGWVTLRKIMEKSINVAAIRLMEEIAPANLNHYQKLAYSGEKIIHYAHELGIRSPLQAVWSLPLGPFGVTPLELAGAYGSIANQGVRVEPFFIRSIRDQNNTVIRSWFSKEKSVLSPEVAYQLTHILEGVVKRGTGYRYVGQQFPDRALGGKTGTTSDFVDAWFVGFSPQYTTAVWAGVDEGNISLGQKMSGGKVAGPIWTEFNKILLKDKPALPFPAPPNISLVPVCYDSGKLPNEACPTVIDEAFIPGTEPDFFCDLHGDDLSGSGLVSPDRYSRDFNTLKNYNLESTPEIDIIKPGQVRDFSRSPFKTLGE